MGEEPSKKKKKSKVWKWIISGLVIFAAVIAVAGYIILHALGNGFPPVVADWLRQKLSEGDVCVTFDRASFTMSDGVHLENVRIYRKHVLGPPIVSAEDLNLNFQYHFDRPAYAWITSASFSGFRFEAIPEFNDKTDETESTAFADFLDLVSVKNDWMTNPIPVHIDRAYVLGFSFRRIDARVSAYGGKLIVDKIDADFDSPLIGESGYGSVQYDPRLKYLTANFKANALPPSVSGFMEYLDFDLVLDYFNDMSGFTVPFAVTGDIRWKFESNGSPTRKDVRIFVDSSKYAYRSMWIKNMKMNLQWLSAEDEGVIEKNLVINPITCQTDKGDVSAALAYYPQQMNMDFSLSSSVPLEYVFDLCRYPFPNVMTNIVSKSSPTFKFSGQFMREASGKPSTGVGDFAYDSVTVYGIPFTKCTSEISIVFGNSVKLHNFKANLFGGDFNGNCLFDFGDSRSDVYMDLDFNLKDANSMQTFHFIGRDLPEDKGKINASLSLSGSPSKDNLDTLVGKLDMHIRDTHLLRIPLFAGITDFMAQHVPGMDTITAQTQADMTASLTNGLVNVSDFKLEGGLFSIVSDNTRCRINKEGMPIEGVAKLRFFKQESVVGLIMRVITMPVSKMMEFRVTGPIGNPTWSYIGLMDRLISIFSDEEDATDLKEQNAPAEPKEEK